MAEVTGWFTVNGVHIPIINGESKASAVNRYINSKHGKSVADSTRKSKKSNSNKKENKDTVSDIERKNKQFEIIKKSNAMTDEYHTGIRSPKDIKTAKEAFKTKISEDEDYLYSDFTKADGLKALEKGTITIYSSHEIKSGTFVSPSKMMAKDYAGNSKIYSKTININDVAWIDSNEGQFAKIE